MRRILYRNTFLISFSLIIAMLLGAGDSIFVVTKSVSAWAACKTSAQAHKPVPAVHFSQQRPAAIKPVLTWTKVEGAVAYEHELLAIPPDNPKKPAPYQICFFQQRKSMMLTYLCIS